MHFVLGILAIESKWSFFLKIPSGDKIYTFENSMSLQPQGIKEHQEHKKKTRNVHKAVKAVFLVGLRGVGVCKETLRKGLT